MAQLPSSLSEARAVISTVRAKAFARHAVVSDLDAWRRGIESACR
jgi:hypothetical protein